MELKVHLQVTAKDVFDKLANSIIEDVRKSTGKTVSIDKIVKKFSYEKSLMNHVGNTVKVKVTIDDFIPNTKYSAIFVNPNGINTIEYTLADKEDGVDILYKEKYESESFIYSWNYFFTSIIYSRSSKKNKRKQFEYLEKEILSAKTT